MATNYDEELTAEVKKQAKKLGATLVGVASVDRFQTAPLLHSPNGLLPAAKSVVVATTIWTDASIELTEKEISEYWYNPADVCESQGGMSTLLNPLVFHLSKFLEKKGWSSLPMPNSTYWRWRPYKTMKDAFAPPLVHRYAAVAAGLGEIGWHNSFITPEYGPRQRLITLVTEAPLKPDPLYNGPPLCDKCMRCVKACPYERFTKEVIEIKEMQIGEKKFKMPITNKWRCHLCYYQINPRFLPKKITEEVAVRIENDGRAPQSRILMDSAACLAACLPPNLRKKDANLYPNSIARKRTTKKITPDKAAEEIKNAVIKTGIDYLLIGSREDFLKKGIDLEDYLPGAASIILIGSSIPYENSMCRLMEVGYHLSCYLQEDLGYYNIQITRLSIDAIFNAFGVKKNEKGSYYHIITSLPISPLKIAPDNKNKPRRKINSAELKSFIAEKGADLVGITSMERLNKIYPVIESALGREKTIVAKNNPSNTIIGGIDMNFTVERIEPIKIKRPDEYMPNAKSVIVLGTHFPYALAERAAKPPAENIGPYANFINVAAPQHLKLLSFEMIRFLKERGYKAVVVPNMEDLPEPVVFMNRFPAVAAGLGEIGWCGAVLTPEYGTTQIFISIVTDAVLEEDSIYKGPKLCKECLKCADTCPANAISRKNKITIKIEDKIFEFGKKDRLRCEWANRFGLVGEEGPKYMGCEINVLPPSKITVKSFEDAMLKVKRLAPVERLNWNIVYEKCAVECPVKGTAYHKIRRT